ncbi:MAG: ribonuclease P protein component 1 [Candidatus Methylarchaceae archaeon HK01B]|nr:ribonuclease P protein component 1 [Candidatus Methylarchaceae archaeon HK01M]MCP8319043.1 ribonuclease P protein component 1 [Candidatus Methylarchaceae archaeon HK01B]
MQITPITIKFHELIGLEARVIKSSDPKLKNLAGTVVDETKNTLKLYIEGKIKIVPKLNSYFIFKLPDGIKVRIHGSLLVGRSEDRLGRFK